MTKIFNHIMENALIYINDILLFSPDESSHKNLLERFHHIVQLCGIMLVEKKWQWWIVHCPTSHCSRISQLPKLKSHKKESPTISWHSQLCQWIYSKSCKDDKSFQPAVKERFFSTVDLQKDKSCTKSQSHCQVTSNFIDSFTWQENPSDWCQQ